MVSLLVSSVAVSPRRWRLFDFFSLLVLLQYTSSQEQAPQYYYGVLISAEALIYDALERLMLFVSFLLNATVCILYIKTWKWPAKLKKNNEQYIATIQNFVEQHSKTLTAEDFAEAKNERTLVDDSDQDDFFSVRIPAPDQPIDILAIGSSVTTSSSAIRTISRECAICYLRYAQGDNIVWSSNPQCRHCYHERCIFEWMIPGEVRHHTCPCCRQFFVAQ